jgi:hypothetical protein
MKADAIHHHPGINDEWLDIRDPVDISNVAILTVSRETHWAAVMDPA